MDERLERVLFTASGSVRTSRTGAYRSEASSAGSEQNSEHEQQQEGSRSRHGGDGLPFVRWYAGNQWHLLAFRPEPASIRQRSQNYHAKTQTFHPKPLYHRLLQLITTLIVSQGVQHRMQSATSCSACIIHSQIPPANSPLPVRDASSTHPL